MGADAKEDGLWNTNGNAVHWTRPLLKDPLEGGGGSFKVLENPSRPIIQNTNLFFASEPPPPKSPPNPPPPPLTSRGVDFLQWPALDSAWANDRQKIQKGKCPLQPEQPQCVWCPVPVGGSPISVINCHGAQLPKLKSRTQFNYRKIEQPKIKNRESKLQRPRTPCKSLDFKRQPMHEFCGPRRTCAAP